VVEVNGRPPDLPAQLRHSKGDGIGDLRDMIDRLEGWV
jgi:hypothetical protein